MKSLNSHLRIVSVGIAAAHKAEGSRFIEVYPIEAIPFLEGDITDDVEAIAVTAENPKRQQYTVNLERTMTVKAEWYGETHRRTAPNIRKGEQVELWTIGNTEKYWWRSMGRDDKLRRREVITWSFAASGSSDEEDIELTDDNTYTFTIDTDKKHITLRTSDDNGEVTRYTIQINTGDGNITAMDDEGNAIQLDTKNTKITLVNKDGTTLSLDKKNLVAFAPGDIAAAANNNISVNAGVNLTLTAGKDVTTTSLNGNVAINVPNGSYNLVAKTGIVFTAPTITVNGQLVVTGGITGGGIGTFAGAINALRGNFAQGPFT